MEMLLKAYFEELCDQVLEDRLKWSYALPPVLLGFAFAELMWLINGVIV